MGRTSATASAALTAPAAAVAPAARIPPVRLLHAFSSFELGGIQSRFVRLAHALGPRFSHVVVAMDDRWEAADRLHGLPNVELLRVPVRGGRLLADVPLLARTLRARRPDRLVSYNWGAFEWTLANALLRPLGRAVPQLHVEEGFQREESTRRLPRRNVVRRFGLPASGATLVVVSETMARIARGEWHVPASRLRVVPNGVDVDAYPDVTRRGRPSRHARVPHERVLGTVAGLRPEKRIDRLLEAFARAAAAAQQAPPLRLVVAGDGPCRGELEAQAAALGIADRVEFLGFQADPRSIYAEMDLFALSSDTEQMPLSVLEAMAAGVPVVSTDVGDVRAMLRNAPPGMPAPVPCDADALARAIVTLARDDAGRLAAGAALRADARERYSSGAMLERWGALYEGRAPGPRGR